MYRWSVAACVFWGCGNYLHIADPERPRTSDGGDTKVDGSEADGPALAPCEAQPANGRYTLIVGPKNHTTIAAALARAEVGDVIEITPGIYPEEVEIDKAVALVPHDSDPVWIDGECKRSHGIRVIASNVKVLCLGIKRTNEAGVLIETTSSPPQNVTLAGLTIQDFNCVDEETENHAGIAVWETGPEIQLFDNQITRRVDLAGAAPGYGNGIWFKSTSSSPSGGGHTIRGNVITGGFTGIGGEGDGDDDPRASFDGNTLIESNTIRDCGKDGIQVEGGDDYITVRSNRIERCGIGIAFAPNVFGPLTIERNVIIDDDAALSLSGESACMKLGGGSGTTNLTENECRIVSQDGDMGDGLKQVTPGLGGLTSLRNVFQVSRYVFEFEDVPQAGSSFDEDCLGTTDSTRFIKWGGATYGDLSSFQEATGQETKGKQSASCPSP